MGTASAKAQRLPQVITTAGRLFATDNKIYMKAEGKRVIGFIKVGKRNLFISNEFGQMKEIRPLCVLDFYVHESVQRGGQGKVLFDLMLASENITAEKLAYDRPSPKLLGFLRKYFGLSKYCPQNNNFVVYDAYWKPQQAEQPVSHFEKFKQHQAPLA